ncbi:hypothetical protein Tco_0937527 [Tanacetum coccineum]|uniref:Uncharacterized protein n=1 Tax=Tanacetum coccineum TaxID=301880 RepID=A0ABQ5DFA5_9ASTR
MGLTTRKSDVGGMHPLLDTANVQTYCIEMLVVDRIDVTSSMQCFLAPHVVPIVDANDVPVPPIIQFGDNFHVGESSSTGALLAGNSWVYAPGPMVQIWKCFIEENNEIG